MVLAKELKLFYLLLYARYLPLLVEHSYLIGLILFNSIGIVLVILSHGRFIESFRNLYNAYGAWIVIIAGFTPFPFKVITIASGLFQLNLYFYYIFFYQEVQDFIWLQD